jgi:uncharacterized membrane protein YhaH (DUF805 family)
MSKTGRVMFWVIFGFLLLLTAGGGIASFVEGVNGNRALSEGVAGTFTPTDRSCGKSQCSWEGTFNSDDGTVTERGVRLRDDEEIERSTPMPTSIDDVRLVYNRDEPAVYTTDYSSGGSIVAGVVFVVGGLAIAVFLIAVKRRHDAKFRRPSDTPEPPPHQDDRPGR